MEWVQKAQVSHFSMFLSCIWNYDQDYQLLLQACHSLLREECRWYQRSVKMKAINIK